MEDFCCNNCSKNLLVTEYYDYQINDVSYCPTCYDAYMTEIEKE